MTREEILEAYDVDSRGTIRSSGKFELEPLYAPAFWEASGDGSAEELAWPDDDSVTYLVEITPDDLREWPEIGAKVFALALNEDGQGFVSCESLTLEEYRELHAHNDRAWEKAEPEEEGDVE